MKKVLAVVALAVALAGCAQVQKVTTAVQAITVGVQNPVTKKDLYAVENGMIIAFAGLNAYKRVCARGVIDPQCKDVIRTLQVYTRQLPSLLANTRTFVKSGDQINAKVAYAALLDVYNRFRSIAAANNVKVQ
jgi:type IV pilus biogenesis protein CpaD/CtpE